MKKNISMQTIADKIGVTKVTVHRALNNRPGVSEVLRAEILQCANEMGYRIMKPDHNYSGISNIAYIVPQHFLLEHERFYSKIYGYLKDICTSCKINLKMYLISNKEEEEAKIPSEIIIENYSGVFFAGFVSNKIVTDAISKNIPVVLIDYFHRLLQADSILSDNYYMGYLATCHLIEKGHKNIGFVGDYINVPNITDRCLGLQKALYEYHLPINNKNYIINDNFKTGLYTLNFELPSPLPTAFVCYCDMAAYYLYEKLKLRGLTVPQDVSIISFDNTETAVNMSPKLTSIYSSRREFADLAFKQMINRIKNPSIAPKKWLIPSKIVVRDSIRDLHDYSNNDVNSITTP